MTILLFSLFAFFVVAVAITARAVQGATAGYEDQAGFHA